LTSSPKDPSPARAQRLAPHLLAFGLATSLLALDVFVGLMGGPAPDEGGLLLLSALGGVALLGVLLEAREAAAQTASRVVALLTVGLFLVALTLGTGGVSSPYVAFLLLHGFLVGSTLPAAPTAYLVAILWSGYVLGVRWAVTSASHGGDWSDLPPLAVQVLAGLFAAQWAARFQARHREQVADLAMQSAHDPLTGLQNRRGFFDGLRHEVVRAQRFSWPLTMLAIDVDHFKRLNDVHGHATGDRVLVEIAQVLRQHAGTFDHVARVGGEEFAVAAVAADAYHGRDLAHRLVREFRTWNWGRIQPGLAVTVSVGVAVLPPLLPEALPDDVMEAAMARADRALYAAKREGRDRVVVAAQAVVALARG